MLYSLYRVLVLLCDDSIQSSAPLEHGDFCSGPQQKTVVTPHFQFSMPQALVSQVIDGLDVVAY